jgi:hypothetical protein
MISAGLAEIDGVFNPGRQKQTEHVEEMKRRRIDLANGSGIDPERGVAVIRLPQGAPDASELPVTTAPPDPPS